MMRDLMDEDGENRAVRCFLMQYGVAGLTVGAMKAHMRLSGYPDWPEWVEGQESGHLTKGGAQHWLRHLFALEGADAMTQARQLLEEVREEVRANFARNADLSDDLLQRIDTFLG
jgi:hypothetical protein